MAQNINLTLGNMVIVDCIFCYYVLTMISYSLYTHVEGRRIYTISKFLQQHAPVG